MIHRKDNGFTLIEIVVVLAILSLAVAVVLPRLPDPAEKRLKTSARQVASAIRYLNDQAISTKNVYRLKCNIAENSLSIVRLSPSGDELPPDDQFMNHRLLQEGVSLVDVSDPKLGTVTEGEVIVPFGPGGNRECLTLHLKGGDAQYTVIAYPAGVRVQVLEGYQEVGA